GIPDIRRNTVRSCWRILAVEPESPLAAARAGDAFAKPVNEAILCLSLKCEDVRPHPRFHGEPRAARGLAERPGSGIGNLDVVHRERAVESDGGVPIVQECAGLPERRVAAIYAIGAEAGCVGGGRAGLLSETPVTRRLLVQHRATILIAWHHAARRS